MTGRTGFETTIASSGAAVLDLVQSEISDLILLELNLPDTPSIHSAPASFAFFSPRLSDPFRL
jgi:DNA-binding response OmpR family regulator